MTRHGHPVNHETAPSPDHDGRAAVADAQRTGDRFRLARRDPDLHPPVTPLFGIDDNLRPCGCDGVFVCDGHESDSPSDAELEAALGDLEIYADLTTRARNVLTGIDVRDCLSPRSRDLFAAMNDFDAAGIGEPPRMSAREHERLWMRIGAALVDQILADRAADPALVVELAASLEGGA